MRSAKLDTTFASAAVRAATLATWIGVATCRAGSEVLLEDSFDYTDAAGLAAGGWATVAGTPAVSSGYSIAATGSGWMSNDAAIRPATQEGFSLMRLANAAVYRELPGTQTGDWTLTVSTLVNAYSRSEYIGLADASGNGYALRWNTALPTNNAGRGVLSLNKLTGWAAGTFANGTLMGSTAVSLVFPIGFELPQGYVDANPVPYRDPLLPDEDPGFQGFSTLEMSWSATTGLLTLAQYSPDELVVMTSVIDRQFSSFSRIYIGGGTSSFIDNISISFASVPEPGAIGLIAVMCGILIARRRAVC